MKIKKKIKDMIMKTDIYIKYSMCRALQNEYKYYSESLSKGGFNNIENFEERYLKLTKDLDNDSAETVSLIVSRIDKLYTSKTISIQNIFSKEEKENIYRFRKQHFSNIVKLKSNLFRYKDYLLPINHFGYPIFYYKHELQHLENLDIIRNRDIIDAGGFIGDSVLVLSKYTDKNVYSFEPTPINYKMMQETIRLNNIKNVVTENVALGDANGELDLNIGADVASGNSINKSNILVSKKTIRVPMVTLDDYVEKNNIEVGLIKADLEGAETIFLKGAVKTIKKYKPALIISIYHTINDFLDIKPLIESWNLGYKFKIVKSVDGNILFETILLAKSY